MLSRKRKSKIQTVSEKITEAILHSNSEDRSSDESDEEPKVVDYDQQEYELPDVQSSEIRKRNIKLLSEQSARYRGKIASRKDYDSENETDEKDHHFSRKVHDVNASKLNENNVRYNRKNFDDDDNDEDDYNGYNDIESSDDEAVDEYIENDFNAMSENKIINEDHTLMEVNRQAEIQKGICVRNQLNVWEKMLELRIHSKKLLNKANILPEPLVLQKELKENKATHNLANELTLNVTQLLQKLLELQCALQEQFPEIELCLKNSKKRRLPSIINSKAGPPATKRFGAYLEQNFTDFKRYRNTVLLKWDDRTRLLTPGATTKKKSLNEEYDIIRKIENALLNRNTLIAKSKILKNHDLSCNSSNDINEGSIDKKLLSHIYDDTDFYHQQLRELIEYKANSSSNVAEVTKQLLELQKVRQKMKKKVDTRASKGRKIRYIVHKKLVNFMAPDDTSSWTEDSKNELCKSLFVS